MNWAEYGKIALISLIVIAVVFHTPLRTPVTGVQ